MHKILPGLLLMVMAMPTLGQPVADDSPRGFYLGAGIGSSSPSSFEGSGWYYWDTETGDSETSVIAFGGYRFNKFVALELGYLDAQDTGFSDTLVFVPELLDIYNTDIDLDVSAAQLSVLGILPFAQIWEVYLRGGLAFWDAEAEQRLTPSFGGVPVSRSVDDDGTGFLFGLGVGVTLFERFHVRLEYQTFEIEEDLLADEQLDAASLDTLSLDLQYRFGGGRRR